MKITGKNRESKRKDKMKMCKGMRKSLRNGEKYGH